MGPWEATVGEHRASRRGATTLEYGLIASLVLVGLLGAVWP